MPAENSQANDIVEEMSVVPENQELRDESDKDKINEIATIDNITKDKLEDG